MASLHQGMQGNQWSKQCLGIKTCLEIKHQDEGAILAFIAGVQ